MKTQHQKIIDMCKDGQWHCQTEFWSAYIRSPHKRRSEIEAKGEWKFEHRPCEHQVKACRDYRMVPVSKVEWTGIAWKQGELV